MLAAIDVTVRLDVQSPLLYQQVNAAMLAAIHRRDDFTCRCCGVRALRYQHSVILDNNWRDLDNIATACIFCQQCFLLDAVALMRSGCMIEFAEQPQAELNRLMIELYMARITMGRGEVARKCLDLLTAKRAGAVRCIGTDDPAEVARMLKSANASEAEGLRAKLRDIRLFPLDRRIIRTENSAIEFNAFPKILNYWRSPAGAWPHGPSGPLPLLEAFAERYL